jgi:DnaJ domain
VTTRYPLAWPETFPRSTRREASRFKATLASALKNVETSLKMFGKDSGKPVSDIVLSSNVTLGFERPDDPGVAVWFKWENRQVCIPCDRYTSAAENLQAIHHVLEARRTELRHGTLALVRATMSGFIALPKQAGADWWEVLKLPRDASRADIETRFRELARERHPDRGGSDHQMAELNRARSEALKERGDAA